MKKYFVYELKKSLFVTLALAVIATAVYLVSVLTDTVKVDYKYFSVPVETILVLGGAMSVIIPIWKLGYLMKKRSVDLYYSLPLSHTRILAVKLLAGLIALFAPYTIAYWVGSIAALASVGKYINGVCFVSMYFASLIPMAIIYSLTAFLFTRANRFVDGVAFVIMTGMSLEMIMVVVLKVVTLYDKSYEFFKYYFNSIYYTPFGSLILIWEYFSKAIMNETVNIRINAVDIVGLALIAVLGLAAGIGLLFAEKRAKAENCEQISESFFGYKVMIPLYTFLLALLGSYDSFILAAVIAAAAYAASVLYKRTPKIGWKFAVIVGVAFIVGVGLSFIPPVAYYD
ncbi:MAG: hypothetical protein HDT28_06750 [Clostridiales bacterium]|nr:hypothetical protein [Clostridiales bacterium]